MRPAPDKGWFFTLNSNQSGSPVQISCNVTDAELRVVKTLFAVGRAVLQPGAQLGCGALEFFWQTSV